MHIPALGLQIIRYLPGTIVPAACALGTTALFTRWLSASGYGNYALAIAAATLLSTMASQWIVQSVNRYIPGEANADERLLIKGAVALGVTGGMAAILICAAVAYSVATWVDAAWRPYVWPASLLAAASSGLASLTGAIQSEMRANRFSLYRMADSGLRLAFASMWLVAFGADSVGVVWAAAIGVSLLLPIAWRDAGIPLAKDIVTARQAFASAARRMAEYGLPMTLWYLFALILSVGDRFLIEAFRGPGELGVYAANYTVAAGGAALLSAPVLLASHPTLMRSWNSGDIEATSRQLTEIVGWFSVIGIVSVGVGVILAEEIARVLLGEVFRSGFAVIPIVFAGVILWQLGMYTQKPLEFANRTTELAIFAVGAVFINVALNVVLLPRFGYAAAAFATVASYAAYVVATYLIGQRTLQWMFPWKRVVFWIATMTIAVTLARIARPDLRAAIGQSFADLLLAGTVLVASAVALVAGYRQRSAIVPGCRSHAV